MEQSIFPIEMWGEISCHDYDVWAALRSLNREFNGAISKITGIFDYVHKSAREVDVNNAFYVKLFGVFRRVFILFILRGCQNCVSVYVRGVLRRSYTYRLRPELDLWQLSNISRYRTETPRSLIECVSIQGYFIHSYYRFLTVDGKVVCNELYISHGRELSRNSLLGAVEYISVPVGGAVPWAVDDAWFLYRP